MTTWLLTGGAGYIGAHVVRALAQAGHRVVVLDDLSTGIATRLPPDVPLVQASLLDGDTLLRTLQEYGVDGVVHLAAKKAVDESMQRPLHYYRENLGGVQVLLRVMGAAGVSRIVYSSSAAVYGIPAGETVAEDDPVAPVNPYGETKLAGEWLIRDVARAGSLRWISLRYFNVAGAGDPRLGDVGVFNLIPVIFSALAAGRRPQVFGSDYPTRDGSCVRDYIHVQDLAHAHVTAVRRLDRGQCGATYNVGRGEGVTVKEVLGLVQAVTGMNCAFDIAPRRLGDPAAVVASAHKIADELGYQTQRDVRDMVQSAWEAWRVTAAPKLNTCSQ